jgi:hypothetical protein
MKSLIILALGLPFMAPAPAQTQVRPEQIVNWSQVDFGSVIWPSVAPSAKPATVISMAQVNLFALLIRYDSGVSGPCSFPRLIGYMQLPTVIRPERAAIMLFCSPISETAAATGIVAALPGATCPATGLASRCESFLLRVPNP